MIQFMSREQVAKALKQWADAVEHGPDNETYPVTADAMKYGLSQRDVAGKLKS